MTVYIDKDFKCHVDNKPEFTAVDVEFFDGKCKEFIEGYRFVPSGEAWGEFVGEMIAPWKPYGELELAQMRYELEDAKAALKVLGVE